MHFLWLYKSNFQENSFKNRVQVKVPYKYLFLELKGRSKCISLLEELIYENIKTKQKTQTWLQIG